MSNATQTIATQGCNLSDRPPSMLIHQGDCINLRRSDGSDETGSFQVIGVDDQHDRCWIRRWPIAAEGGSPVFEVSMREIVAIGC